ncbi:LysR family transcriptional regulator [Bradyrhizobium lablabi]|uniref:LysR family transcriptional regulator n=1 Tax=Bradyrhizobium lablabi TaxID=722472 RepID=UPI001BAB093C|nr:LysR family transcriptional regulator [Bradyrhizobium lablabi]MBR0695651.1 LysR family transcriptional regulator [Bradyrhizobium lablabi]
MDLIAALRTFLRVAEVGSFSAVAEERGVTQPAVSRQVSALEEHFGTRLVQRSTHAVTLTDEGREFVPAAQQLVDSADALEERTGRRRTKPVGRVRLSVPVSLGLYFSSKLGSLIKKYDELSIELLLHDSLRDLIEEGIDLQVCVGEVSDSALISRRIGAGTLFLVAAPAYLKGRAAPKEPADLRQHDCIVYRGDEWWFAGPQGAVSVSVHGRFRANNSEAVRLAALNGHGVALLSHLLVADDIATGRLRALMPEFPPARVPLTLVYPSRRNLPPRIRAVIEFLSETVQADPALRDDGSVVTLSQSDVSGPH